MKNEAQERFDKMYITSTEIIDRLKTSRAAIFYRKEAGHLPNPITFQGRKLYIWEREAIEPYIQEWEMSLSQSRASRAW